MNGSEACLVPSPCKPDIAPKGHRVNPVSVACINSFTEKSGSPIRHTLTNSDVGCQSTMYVSITKFDSTAR